MNRVNPRKFQRLPRQTVWIDERGRVTIPAYLLKAVGIERSSWAELEAVPDLENCKTLRIRKG